MEKLFGVVKLEKNACQRHEKYKFTKEKRYLFYFIWASK